MKELEDKVARRIEAAIQGYSARTGNRLSWASLAREIGYTSQAPTKWKKGAINYKVIEKIAEYLGADPVWLTYGSPNEEKLLRTAGGGKSRFTNPHINGFDPSFNPIEKEAEFLKNFEDQLKAIKENISFESYVPFDSIEVDHFQPHFRPENEGNFLNNIIIIDRDTHQELRGVRLVPVITYAQVGNYRNAVKEARENFVASYAENLSEYAFALEVKDESMSPEFKPGDKIIVDPAVLPNPGDQVVAIEVKYDGADIQGDVQNNGAEATFMKYRPRGYDDKGEMIFELAPLNPDYPILNSDKQPIRIVGTVVEHSRSLKRRLN